MNLSPDLNDEANLDLLTSTSELILIQHLAKYDEVVWQAYQEYEPYHIVQYLFQLV
jgi:arginyl-tRNA synthetase